MALSGRALGQQITITGTVTTVGGEPISDVTVRLDGTQTSAITSAIGRYSINAPADGALTFSRVGRRQVQVTIAGRTKIDVTMAPIAYLEQVVVTAYTEQRRADITGAVGSINIESAARQTGASVLQKLDAVPGITVAASGSPGSRSTVRIRGISSFQNNDPLYVIDGVPVEDSYINWLNPNDITSIQVLKDASSASIYGSRASNGVIVIETTQRGASGPPRVNLSVRTGIATPVNGYDKFLLTNALDYFKVVKQAYTTAGSAVPTNIYGDPNNPTVPQYTYAEKGTNTGTDAFGRPTGVDPSKYSYPNSLIMPGSAGTNWWKAVFGSAKTSDVNLNVSGAGQDNTYGLSFNYFDQGGTAAYNDFRRGSIRVNSTFNRGALQFGENAALSTERHYGGLPDDQGGETALIGKNILMQPVVPVYDIQHNFASGKAVGLGNNSNPLKEAFERRNNITKNNRVFGNVFASLAATSSFSLRSSLGFNVGEGAFVGFTPIYPENSEPTLTNSLKDSTSQALDWTWSNTARFVQQRGQHNVSVLVGQEANRGTSRYLAAGLTSLTSTELNTRYVQNILGDYKTKTINTSGVESALLSYFGKADYNFADRYVASLTVRRDGSSRLGPSHRWGTFPAIGLGWRVSKEKFFENNGILSDAMLRFGWGVTGNQLIPAGRTVDEFGGDVGDTYYDITGSNNAAPGYRQISVGNADLKWEEDKSTNVGADLAFLDGRVNVIIDLYKRQTNNLLFNPQIPGTAGAVDQPILNVGQMQNIGVDFSVGYQATNWNATLTGSKYNNKILSIDGKQKFFYGPQSTRFGNQVINQVGSPISSFYGLIADGYFRDAADVASHAHQDGAAPGRIKFRDTNGDGSITPLDQVIIGNPHPDFTAGLDLGYQRGNWSVNGTVFGSFGNDIWDAQKEFYVFRNFSTNVRKDLLENSWRPDNLNAKYPILDQNDTYSKNLSSYYIEDGSYVRMRSLQVAYTLPHSLVSWAQGTRVYVQAENLFTFTGYSGLDPSLPASSITGSGGDIRDQYRGIDRGVYPSSRTFSFGITTSF